MAPFPVHRYGMFTCADVWTLEGSCWCIKGGTTWIYHLHRSPLPWRLWYFWLCWEQHVSQKSADDDALSLWVLSVCHVGPGVLFQLLLLRMKRLWEGMSAPRTLSPTRYPWTLGTTSVVARSSPASGCWLLLTATRRKCIKLIFETLLWIQWDSWTSVD